MTPEHLRFDFTHFEALSSEQLKAVEDLVNQQIFASKPVVTRVMGIDEAKAAGAVALFGEKYGDVVRVVSVGAEDQPFSRELAVARMPPTPPRSACSRSSPSPPRARMSAVSRP